MLRKYLENKNKLKSYFETEHFFEMFGLLKSSLNHVILIEDTALRNAVESIFINKRKSIFFETGKSYYVTYEGVLFEKRYTNQSFILAYKLDK